MANEIVTQRGINSSRMLSDAKEDTVVNFVRDLVSDAVLSNNINTLDAVQKSLKSSVDDFYANGDFRSKTIYRKK